MECQKCNVKITPTNWSRYVRSLKHLKNEPDQTIPPRRRGRPKTKPPPDQSIKPKKPKSKRVNNVTRKELLSQARDYNIKGHTKCNKQQLLAVLGKVKKLVYKKHELQQLTQNPLINIAKENRIKVNLEKMAEIIEAILKTQDSVFREIVAVELSFHKDLIERTKEERKLAYTIIKTNSRFIKNLTQPR